MSQHRPSQKEISSKIIEAKQILDSGTKNRFFADAGKAIGELDDLKLTAEEAWVKIRECLDEVQAAHYCGGRPPHRSYEPAIKNSELWAYRWKSHVMNMEVYLKFALKNGNFFYVSFHESRQKQ
jgi:hypothetical protein